MNKETQKETNENVLKEQRLEKDKNFSSIYSLKEKDHFDSRINGNFQNLQNSAFKNLKNECANPYM